MATAQARGLTATEAEALRLYLVDRAAQMDGATRLEMAKRLLPPDEQATIDRFLVEAQALRRQALERGIAELNAMSDEEWERLVDGG